MKIEITQEDCNIGIRKNPVKCPAALAIHRTTNKTIAVGNPHPITKRRVCWIFNERPSFFNELENKIPLSKCGKDRDSLIEEHKRLLNKIVELPYEASDAIKIFDAGGQFEPMTFELEI